MNVRCRKTTNRSNVQRTRDRAAFARMALLHVSAPEVTGHAQPMRLYMLRYDLHSHSTHSDGLLTPTELVRRAAQRGVDVLALTDHDELSGLAAARAAASEAGLRLTDGAELSDRWRGVTWHVPALPLDPECPARGAAL